MTRSARFPLPRSLLLSLGALATLVLVQQQVLVGEAVVTERRDLGEDASARRLAVRVGGALVCFQIDFPQDRPADWWRDPACASRHHHPLARAGAGQAGEGD